MIPGRILIFSAMLGGTLVAGARPGKATVEWIGASQSCEPGRPLQTAIRLIHDPGWHTYWINPGEAGMKTTVEWKLPPGWKTSGLMHPPPVRFTAGDLTGFGYEGTLLFPVTITAPANFSGEARLSAVLAWLACNDFGCVPGETEIHLVLSSRPPKPTKDAGEIQAAYRLIPKPPDGDTSLSVTERDGNVKLEIKPAPDFEVDLSRHSVFPATPDVLDPRADIRFSKTGATWKAIAPKNKYNPGPVKQLTLVLSSDAMASPLEFTWSAP